MIDRCETRSQTFQSKLITGEQKPGDMISECDGLFGSILTAAGVAQVRGSGGSPTWLRHGPGLTLHGGAGRRGNPDTGHVGGLDLELVEGALGQTVDLEKTEMSGVFGPCLCACVCVRILLCRSSR